MGTSTSLLDVGRYGSRDYAYRGRCDGSVGRRFQQKCHLKKSWKTAEESDYV